MAVLPLDKQEFVDLKNGLIVGIHLVTPQSASGDTFEVPKLVQTDANSASSRGFRLAGATSSPTTTDGATTGDNTITLANTVAGEQCLVVTVHGPSMINFGDEVTDD